MADQREEGLIYLEGLIETLRSRTEKINTVWLKAVGKRIRKLDGLDPSDAAGIEAIRNDTQLVADIEDMISKFREDSVEDARNLLRLSARLSVEASPIAKTLAMEEWINGIAEASAEKEAGRIANLAHTTAVGVRIGDNFMTTQQAYVSAIDRVAAQMGSGTMGLNAAKRAVLKQFADSGLYTVEYQSGRHRSLGAAVEMNLKEATSMVYQGVQERIGQEYGADGWEVSAHGDCAPDHLDIQGKQYSKKEFEKLQGRLKRPIGKLNCRHTIYAIILGVSPATYSKAELQAMKESSLKKTSFQGKEMTAYEASQAKRKLKREMRKQKNRNIIATAAGDDIMRRETKLRCNQLATALKTLALPETKKTDIIITGVEAIKDAFLNGKTSNDICKAVIENHEALAGITPAGMKEWFEKNGFEVEPLGRGNFKNIPFEEGGGYRVHFFCDGYFQYHPEEHSHHKEAYWKVSNGKKGKNRYGMGGNQE